MNCDYSSKSLKSNYSSKSYKKKGSRFHSRGKHGSGENKRTSKQSKHCSNSSYRSHSAKSAKGAAIIIQGVGSSNAPNVLPFKGSYDKDVAQKKTLSDFSSEMDNKVMCRAY